MFKDVWEMYQEESNIFFLRLVSWKLTDKNKSTQKDSGQLENFKIRK